MIYARQISPECQVSPLFFPELCIPENIIIHGNGDYESHFTPEAKQLTDHLDEMADEWEQRSFYYKFREGCWILLKQKPSVGELLSDYGVKRSDGKNWSNKQKHAWKVVLETVNWEDRFMYALQLLTGKVWQTREIHGSCQGEWQRIYYPIDEWSGEHLQQFEAEYFNTGSEWIIHEGSDTPKEAADIEGYSIYCTEPGFEGIRKEIAICEGVSPDEVVMYRHAGYVKMAVYETV